MVGVRQIAETHRFCVECQFNYHIDATFFCPMCDKIICGACAYRRHRKHRCNDLTAKELENTTRNECQEMRQTFIEYNKAHNPIQESVTQLVAKVEELLLDKIDNVRMMEKFEEANRESSTCMDYRQYFKRISKEYLQHVRTFENKMHTLSKKLESEQNQLNHQPNNENL